MKRVEKQASKRMASPHAALDAFLTPCMHSHLVRNAPSFARALGLRMHVCAHPLLEIICARMLAAQPVLSHALLGQLLAPRSFCTRNL